jgi:hypothetical protein
MSIDLSREGLEIMPDDREQAELEYLRAHGVRVGPWNLDRPRVIGKPRPWWLALMLRNLRRLHLIRD